MIKKYTPRNTENIDEKKNNLLTKIDKLLVSVESVYGNRNLGTYNFVTSVRNYVDKNGNASRKQLDALNRVVKQIENEKKKISEGELKKSLVTHDEIPW